MCVCADNLSTRSSILNSTVNETNLEQELILFDKSDNGYVEAFIADIGLSHFVQVKRSSIEQTLVSTISQWGASQEPDISTWVQILAEDDSFTPFSVLPCISKPDTVMLLCPMLYVYKDRLVFEDQILAKNGFSSKEAILSFGHGVQPFCDSSWHGLIRMDVFYDYCKWLSELPYQLWNISNAGLWVALSRGSVGVLNSFAFIKDAGRWQTDYDTVLNVNKLYLDLFQIEDGILFDQLLYWLGVLSLLYKQRQKKHDIKIEQCINFAVFSILVSQNSKKNNFYIINYQKLEKIILLLFAKCLLALLAFIKSPSQLYHINNFLINTIIKKITKKIPNKLQVLVSVYLHNI